PLIANHDPDDLRSDQMLVPPSVLHGGEFLFGTDNYGRDIFSRVVWGSRISVTVAFAAVTIGGIVGALFGLTSAFVGGWYDLVLQRFIDSVQAIPGVILALAIMAALGSSLTNVIIAIALGLIAMQARVIRAQALGIKENMYVEAARASGAPGSWILARHIMPN